MNEIGIKNSIIDSIEVKLLTYLYDEFFNDSIEVKLWTYLYDEFFINFYLLNEIEIFHAIKDYLNIK